MRNKRPPLEKVNHRKLVVLETSATSVFCAKGGHTETTDI